MSIPLSTFILPHSPALVHTLHVPFPQSNTHHCVILNSFRCPSPRETTLVRRCGAFGDILVSLTQTKSRGKEHKDDVVNKIREAVDAFKYIYVLEFDNMRTNAFKDLRGQLSDCRLVVLSKCYPIDSS